LNLVVFFVCFFSSFCFSSFSYISILILAPFLLPCLLPLYSTTVRVLRGQASLFQHGPLRRDGHAHRDLLPVNSLALLR
jgi:hypothetical protein